MLRLTGMPHSGYILVVDDEPSIRQTLTAILETQAYRVCSAGDGLEALTRISNELPWLLISDLRMPRMDGFELLATVRQRYPSLPLIAISGEYCGGKPDGLVADVFLMKGSYTIEQLFQVIHGL